MPLDPQAIQAQLQQLQSQPTWEDVKELISQDGPRGFRIDIETDSTIQADQALAQQNMGQFVQGFSSFITAIGPAVQAGAVPMDVAKDLLAAFARQFKLGRQAEDAIERLGGQSAPQQPANPEAGKQMAELQKAQMDNETAQKKIAADSQNAQAKIAAEAQMHQEKMALELKKHDDTMVMQQRQHQEEMALKRESAQKEGDFRLADLRLKQKEQRNTLADPADSEGLSPDLVDPHEKAQLDHMSGMTNAIVSAVQALQQTLSDIHKPRKTTLVRDAAGRATHSITEPA